MTVYCHNFKLFFSLRYISQCFFIHLVSISPFSHTFKFRRRVHLNLKIMELANSRVLVLMSSWSQNTFSLRMFAHLILTLHCWLDTNWLKFALNFMAIFLQLCGLSIVSWNRGPRLGADPVPGSLLFFCFVFLNFILKLFFLFFFFFGDCFLSLLYQAHK